MPDEPASNGPSPPREEQVDAEVGPMLPESLGQPSSKKRKVLPFEDQYLERLPLADMYEKSFMHKDWVTHVAFAPSTEFFISASVDGVVKFWKKGELGIEFAKQYKAHLGPIIGLEVSSNGSLCASVSRDATIKVFDVATFDMIGMIKLDFEPGCACWGFKGTKGKEYLVVSEKKGPGIHLYDVRDPANANNDASALSFHSSPVVAMAFNDTHECVISTDSKGAIEYWSPSTRELVKEEDGLAFGSKFKTDLYALMKAKTRAKCITIARDGTKFAVLSADDKIRLFRFLDGRLLKVIDESIDSAQAIQLSDPSMFQLDPIDYGRRLAAEKELRNDPEATMSMCFDASGHFLFYPTLIGIKVLNLTTNRVVRLMGKVENTERFCCLALYEPGDKKLRKIPDWDSSKKTVADPTLFCSAYHRQRFYLFTQREPELDESDTQGRDVFNEKPMVTHNATQGVAAPVIELPRGAVLHTTLGDIWLRLFPDEVPKTVENFATLAKKGMYDGVVFHRVIKGFMVQTGDPQGDGTGGESCWGGEFEDEFHRSLKHDRPFTLSMANAGPNTNGSQFFITCVPTPWLDNKHSVFGRCVRGGDVVTAIENVEVDRNDRPVEEIQIMNISLRAVEGAPV